MCYIYLQLQATISLLFLVVAYVVIAVVVRPLSHSRCRSGTPSRLALPAPAGSLSGSPLAPLPQLANVYPAATRHALPPAVDMSFLVQVPPFQRPLHAPYGPTSLAVYSPYKPPTIPPVESHIPDVSIKMQGTNYYIHQSMAVTSFLFWSLPATTTPVSSSVIAVGGEEGCLAFFITLTTLFITILFLAFNGLSDENGEMESCELKMTRGEIGRRYLANFVEDSGSNGALYLEHDGVASVIREHSTNLFFNDEKGWNLAEPNNVLYSDVDLKPPIPPKSTRKRWSEVTPNYIIYSERDDRSLLFCANFMAPTISSHAKVRPFEDSLPSLSKHRKPLSRIQSRAHTRQIRPTISNANYLAPTISSHAKVILRLHDR